MFFLGFCVMGANSKNKPASIQILRKTVKNKKVKKKRRKKGGKTAKKAAKRKTKKHGKA